MICSKIKLCSELDKIKQLLIESGYPADVASYTFLDTFLHQSKTSQLCSRKNVCSREVPDVPESALDW